MPDARARTTPFLSPRSRRIVIILLIILPAAALSRTVWQRLRLTKPSPSAAGSGIDPSFSTLPILPGLPSPDPISWKGARDFLSHLPPDLPPDQAMQAADRARQIGDITAARALLREARVRAPSDLSLIIALAEIDRGMLRDDEARELYLDALRRDPGRTEPYIGMADLALLEGKREVAWKWMKTGTQAIEKFAMTEANFVAMAQAFQGMNDFPSAEVMYKRAVQAAPNDSHPQLRLAGFLLSFGRVAESRALLEPIIAKQPDNAQACRLLAANLTNAASDRPDFARARILVEKALRVSPRDTESLRLAGLIYRHDNLNQRAAQAYASLLTLDPESVDGRYAAGQVYALLGQAQISRRQMELSALLRQRERIRAGLYVEALRHPRNSESHFALAKSFEESGQYFDAVREYQIASQLDARSGKYWSALKDLYRKLGWEH